MNSRFRIMVVDDDPRIRRTLSDILNLNGYRVVEAASGEEALSRDLQVDCVLSDNKMPGMSGVELFEAVQKIRPGIPVILMTAFATNDLIRRGLQAGVIAVMEKPLDIEQLLGYCNFFQKL